MSNIPSEFGLPKFVLEGLDGFLSAKMVYAGCVALLVYDYALCIDREIDFFWKKEANRLTKSLYYLNRLCPVLSFCFRSATLFHYSMSDSLCKIWIRFDLAWTIIALYLAEAVLVVRVYNLYAFNKMAQWFILITSMAGGLVALAVMIDKLTILTIMSGYPIWIHQSTAGCIPNIPKEFWSVFIPVFITETVFFLLTLYRVRKSLARGGSSHPLALCLIMDGAFFYIAVLASAGVCLAGGVLIYPAPQVSAGALYSNATVAVCSIASCRLILSIRTLAARLKYDPDAIFNHLELARIYGNGVGKVRKSGEFGSRIVIEIGNGDIELEDIGQEDKQYSKTSAQTTAESMAPVITANSIDMGLNVYADTDREVSN